ncbi:malectin domain-containing carbohydrate-binding protein [Pontibacter pamirensis]|uniref:malectin domain-containing carbohydrate-binding protein n=1 Tax=Pontibacter pamirensis TaxID=2562824 RepID=UPI001389A353|nr:malectin domain-containing carbohydrate-binding protein [Pontibacter pamirensis]
MKADRNGTKLWDKTLGGNAGDYLQDIVATPDGGYLLGGFSLSGVGNDKTTPNQGGYDYWIVKLDRNGVKLWDKTFGGTSDDRLYALVATADGGFLLGGYSNSGSNGDKSVADKGGFDYWVIKINGNGDKQWDKVFGGTSNDQLQALISTVDGGFLLGGTSSSSIGGDKSQGSRRQDYWIIKISSSGAKQWDKTFSGNRNDALTALVATQDGGYLVGGSSDSNAGYDKSEANRGNLTTDYWILKVNRSGVKQWDKTLGGSQHDFLSSMLTTPDGDHLLGGYSYSGKGGDKGEASKGKADCWLIKINSSGNKVWGRTWGGSNHDYNIAMVAATNSSYFLGNFSFSGRGFDKGEASKGSADYWLMNMEVSDGTQTTIHINAGGSTYTDSQLGIWGADAHSTSGVTSSKFFDVAGTDDDELYLRYRFSVGPNTAAPGAPFSYSIPMNGAGLYKVKLYFLEPYFGAPGGVAGSAGKRVFHVTLEGRRVLSNFDIYEQHGAGNAVVKTFENVSVTDGTLDIDFTSVANNAIVSAIEAVKVADQTNTSAALMQDLMEDASSARQLTVYPNPGTGGRFYVEARSFGKNEAVALTLYDGLGRVIKSVMLATDGQGAFSAEVSLGGHVSRGVYILKASAVSGTKQSRLVIE